MLRNTEMEKQSEKQGLKNIIHYVRKNKSGATLGSRTNPKSESGAGNIVENEAHRISHRVGQTRSKPRQYTYKSKINTILQTGGNDAHDDESNNLRFSGGRACSAFHLHNGVGDCRLCYRQKLSNDKSFGRDRVSLSFLVSLDRSSSWLGTCRLAFRFAHRFGCPQSGCRCLSRKRTA